MTYAQVGRKLYSFVHFEGPVPSSLYFMELEQDPDNGNMRVTQQMVTIFSFRFPLILQTVSIFRFTDAGSGAGPGNRCHAVAQQMVRVVRPSSAASRGHRQTCHAAHNQ